MKAIVSQIILTGFSSRADGSLGFRGVTPEMSVPEKVAMMSLQNLNCRALFEPQDYATDGKVEIKNPLDRKTPSQRLRAIMFVEFKEKRLDAGFEEYYIREMDKICEQRKALLQPAE